MHIIFNLLTVILKSYIIEVRVMVFNAFFNSISVILWRFIEANRRD